MDDSGFPRTFDRLLESFGTRACRSEVFETMMGAGGPLNSGGSATASFTKKSLTSFSGPSIHMLIFVSRFFFVFLSFILFFGFFGASPSFLGGGLVFF